MIIHQNKKLIIRSMQKKDINKSFIKTLNNKNLNKYTFGNKRQSLTSAREYFNNMIENEHLYLRVIDKKENKFIGTITLRKIKKYNYALGYMIFNTKYFGNKLFFDAVKMSLKFLKKNYNIKKILGNTIKQNLASSFFLIKLGFKLKKKTKEIFTFELK